MSLRERHHDVAAYALGVLEPADALRCEEHLARCAPCSAALADFAVAVSALGQLADREPLCPRRVQGTAPPRPRRCRAARGRRARGRRAPVHRWRMRLAGVAAALAVAVPGAALLVPEEDPAPVLRASATDAATGVAAAVALRDREWGTELALRVTGVRGTRVCELVVVGTDGRAWPVMTWAAKDGDEPVMEGGTALRLGEIERLEVRSVDGERLVSVRP
ncbi:zf-HC2 domain-containing protein [Streptomyces ficellus]|uniref:Zf-HC2 domain-containing protein n=1 Tax=Streptomyces ficellus TaxID=1977088 RepID=A0ABT7Z5W0_9ACTN|nr:zf-HC2 domain-containing protein [Streptomyces ficellus]MDN3294870.1 zf-HC2 domain-containing protein [Streptomyces ficellus]